MKIYLLVFIILILVSILYLKLANKYGIVDTPNKRSSHTNITFSGGGIIFTFAILLFCIFNNLQYFYFCTGVIVLSFISLLDDIYKISLKIRILFQVIAIILLFLQVEIDFYILLPLFLIAFFLVNAFNFMDGINGITAIYSLSSLIGIFFINNIEKAVHQDLIVYPFFAIIIFAFFNLRKRAIFFAGDIGSTTMGFLILFLIIKLILVSNTLLFLLFTLVYNIDVGLTLFHRLFLTKESVFVPHRNHIYEKLVDLKKMSHLKVAFYYSLLQVFINVIIYYSYRLEMDYQIAIFISLVLFFMSTYIYFFKKLTKVYN
jgi:UDP-N-acetylmuramyl pentapeptide phosphotransferase/UDP-N-acetylglucosamine-1-phosphate transferase